MSHSPTADYALLLNGHRRRPSRVTGRPVVAEADADRGRVLFSAPFRRLQNKAQVFSLESNAAVRSRLTHSLEVSSISRLVAQETISRFTEDERKAIGLSGLEAAMLAFVETACLVHDLGNPPFGHFGERAIADWFHANASELAPTSAGTQLRLLWDRHYGDFRSFDGNPQGFRILSRLQPERAGDTFGFNLTAGTLAATIKYPWGSDRMGSPWFDQRDRKKFGYYKTEEDVYSWIRSTLGLKEDTRYPLVYLMEAADDIAYCVSDVEDGVEKGLVSAEQFGQFVLSRIENLPILRTPSQEDMDDAKEILDSMATIRDGDAKRTQDSPLFNPLLPFRSALVRLLCRQAGHIYYRDHNAILEGRAGPILEAGDAAILLEAVKAFANAHLYSCDIVRNREITAHAVLSGLLNAYKPLMVCERDRFERAVRGAHRDSHGAPIGRESGLMSRLSPKYVSAYRDAVADFERRENSIGAIEVIERVFRLHLFTDYVSGMTDEFALQSYRLISGIAVSPFRA